LKINENYRLIKLNEELSKNTNLISMLEKFNAPNEFMKNFKKQKEKKVNKTNDVPTEENKYLIRLKECLKLCFVLEVSPQKPEDKIKQKEEILKKYFK